MLNAKRLSLHFDFDRSRVQTFLALLVILALAAYMRLQGLHWDDLAGLHPDERHMLFLTQELLAGLNDSDHAWRGLADWWFALESPLNPHQGDRFLVYGQAPLLAVVVLAHTLGLSDWFEVMLLARTVAATVDIAAILAVFFGGRLLSGGAAGLWVAAIYATMPSALQLARFHTVDIWLASASAAALLPLLALALGRGKSQAAPWLGLAAGAMIGLALASKITGIVMVLAAFCALVLARQRGLGRWHTLVTAVAMFAAAALVFRLANPFAFVGNGFWGLAINPMWINSFRTLESMTTSSDFPPNWQWEAGYGPGAFFRDVALFGTGPVAAGLFLWLLLTYRGAWGALLVPLTTVFAFLLLTHASSVNALRYLAPALPALAMSLAPLAVRLYRPAVLGTILLALWWGSGAFRLGDGQHPRLIASYWLWSLPEGTVLTNESDWDEGLPVIIRDVAGDGFRFPSHDNWFRFQTLGITDPDSPEKADRIARLLEKTDFLIMSSDRQSAVMPRLPERFPMTAEHYAALFSGAACFRPVLILERGYPLPLFPFDDSWAQEPWRIYDHPPVRIFAREACYDAQSYSNYLRAALEPDTR